MIDNLPANAFAIALGIVLGVLATLAAVLPLLYAAIDQRDADRTALTIAKRRNAQQADEITQQAQCIAQLHDANAVLGANVMALTYQMQEPLAPVQQRFNWN